MNALERWIEKQEEDDFMILNDLQLHGIISDECVEARDVDAVDSQRAVKWLEETR